MKRAMTMAVGGVAFLFAGAWLGSAMPSTEAGDLKPEPVPGPIEPAPAPVPAFDLNPIKREPVLIYDLTGGTLVGTFHTNIVVYNDGLTSFARKDWIVFPGPPQEIEDADVGFATDAQVAQLIEELQAAGASTRIDDQNVILDVPVATVTFFPRPAPRARNNTFSFFSAGGSEIEQIIDDFADIVLGM